MERTALRVPREYLSLHKYLDHRYASMVVLTFQQIEALLGFSLPALAGTDAKWWTPAAPDDGSPSAAWIQARRTALPNLLARTVTFERRE